MSDTGTQQFNAAIAPMAGVSIQGQLGPDIVGSGSMVFNGPGTVYFYFAPQTQGQSSVNYGNNGSYPGTPLPPYVWTPIPSVSNLNLSYSANPGSDLKLVWAA
jgi:hypothetical protein